MPFPKLSPLQSRLTASLAASFFVLMLYLALSSSSFAFASEFDSINAEDQNHERLLSPYIHTDEIDLESGELSYEPNFFGADRSIIGRAPAGVDALENNQFALINVEQNTTVHYMFPNATLWGPLSGDTDGLPSPVMELRRRSGDVVDSDLDEKPQPGEIEGLRIRQRQLGSRTLYITINSCLQPYDPNDVMGTKGPPPQLELYVSQSAKNPTPGPDQDSALQQKVTADGGFASITVKASDDVFIGVYAPLSQRFVNPYNVEIAASIDAPFHSYNKTQPNLYLVDSDSNSALLVTNNLTTTTTGSVFKDWMDLPPPFVVFAANKNSSVISGVRNSYCGLEKYAQIAGTKGGVRTSMVQTSMNNVTLGPFPKQQFYFQGLNGSSDYFGILGMTGNSTAAGNGVVGGGGRIWQYMNFSTQTGMSNSLVKSFLLTALKTATVPWYLTSHSVTLWRTQFPATRLAPRISQLCHNFMTTPLKRSTSSSKMLWTRSPARSHHQGSTH
jgi:calcium channel MID1